MDLYCSKACELEIFIKDGKWVVPTNTAIWYSLKYYADFSNVTNHIIFC